METDVRRLIEALPEKVNAEPTLLRIGRYCSTEFLFEADDVCFNLVVDRGRLTDVIAGPLKMRGWSFGLRASSDAWRAFWQPHPRPEYADIFAMTRYGHLVIDGDVGPLLGNLRYIKEVVAMPRRMLAGDAA